MIPYTKRQIRAANESRPVLLSLLSAARTLSFGSSMRRHQLFLLRTDGARFMSGIAR
jgi:hypothetical protein